MDLHKILSLEDQAPLLYELFGLVIDMEDGCIYDQDGNDFYEPEENVDFDFTTLKGIIDYSNHLAHEMGKLDMQIKLREALGLN